MASARTNRDLGAAVGAGHVIFYVELNLEAEINGKLAWHKDRASTYLRFILSASKLLTGDSESTGLKCGASVPQIYAHWCFLRTVSTLYFHPGWRAPWPLLAFRNLGDSEFNHYVKTKQR